jgi:hypothetical protein
LAFSNATYYSFGSIADGQGYIYPTYTGSCDTCTCNGSLNTMSVNYEVIDFTSFIYKSVVKFNISSLPSGCSVSSSNLTVTGTGSNGGAVLQANPASTAWNESWICLPPAYGTYTCSGIPSGGNVQTTTPQVSCTVGSGQVCTFVGWNTVITNAKSSGVVAFEIQAANILSMSLYTRENGSKTPTLNVICS